MLILSESFACDHLSMNSCYESINPFSSTAICIALVVYDYSLTLAREVDLIWFSRWNVIKVTFLVQRYLPFLDAILLSIIGMFPRIYEHFPMTQALYYSKLSNRTTQFIPVRFRMGWRLVSKHSPHCQQQLILSRHCWCRPVHFGRFVVSQVALNSP
jgi:hypothetical protein